MANLTHSKWPKSPPPLSEEQKKINDAFMQLWHEVLPKKYGKVDRFGHEFAVNNSPKNFTTTLEIGAGLGEHIDYENLSLEQANNYYALEFRENMAEKIRSNYPHIQTVVGDCQDHINFPNNHFDRILAIHVLEHLPNLPACIKECHRLINKETGKFIVLIPTEGSLAYSLARKISAERVYKKHFGGDYSWIYKREHINLPHEIFEELSRYFVIEDKSFFPLPFMPLVFCNLVIGIVLTPRRDIA